MMRLSLRGWLIAIGSLLIVVVSGLWLASHFLSRNSGMLAPTPGGGPSDGAGGGPSDGAGDGMASNIHGGGINIPGGAGVPIEAFVITHTFRWPKRKFEQVVFTNSNKWGHWVKVPLEFDYYYFDGPPETKVEFADGTIGLIHKQYGPKPGIFRFSGSTKGEVTVYVNAKPAPQSIPVQGWWSKFPSLDKHRGLIYYFEGPSEARVKFSDGTTGSIHRWYGVKQGVSSFRFSGPAGEEVVVRIVRR